MKIQIELSGERGWSATVYLVDEFTHDRTKQQKVFLMASYRPAGTLAGTIFNVIRRLRHQLRGDNAQ